MELSIRIDAHGLARLFRGNIPMMCPVSTRVLVPVEDPNDTKLLQMRQQQQTRLELQQTQCSEYCPLFLMNDRRKRAVIGSGSGEIARVGLCHGKQYPDVSIIEEPPKSPLKPA